MKFAIDCGHNCPPDTGAVGILEECKLTRAVGNYVIQGLKASGHKAIDVTPARASTVTGSLRQRVSKANSEKVDIYVSIHFNAFNQQAHGTEIFATSKKGRDIAAPVLQEICKLGFFNRGVKNGSHLLVVRETQAPAILIECCFIDSKRDMDIFDVAKMGEAIINGLRGSRE